MVRNSFQNYQRKTLLLFDVNAREGCKEGGHMRVSALTHLVTAYLIGWNINEVGGDSDRRAEVN